MSCIFIFKFIDIIYNLTFCVLGSEPVMVPIFSVVYQYCTLNTKLYNFLVGITVRLFFVCVHSISVDSAKRCHEVEYFQFLIIFS